MSGAAHVDIKLLDERAVMPSIAYEGDAGFDLIAIEGVFIPHGERKDIRTGIAIGLPMGFYARLVGRSSAIRKRNLLVVEGIIDAGFRGELLCHAYALPQVTGLRLAGEGVQIEPGDSVGQLIISPIPHVVLHEAMELRDSERGERGFGSSGR